jgi:hypothetical protein
MSDDPRDSWWVRALECTPLRLTIFVALVAAALSPIFAQPRNGGATLDWQFFELFDEVARKTLLQYHQLPIWNPYFCGGITQVGNPQTSYLVPTFPLVLWFGTTFGERLSDIPVLVIGCEGGYRLIRHLGLRPPAALVGATTFALFGRTFAWMHDGQHGLAGVSLTGWIFYGYLRGLERPKYLALGGAFFAWLISYRGIETGPEVAFLLALWALFLCLARLRAGERNWRAVLWPAAACAAVGAFALGFAGLRMLPVLETVLVHPRIIDETRSNGLLDAFVRPYAFPGGYAFVGVTTYVLFVAAVLLPSARKRAAIALLATFVCGALVLGMHGPLSPLAYLHALPLYRSLRNPALWTVVVAFTIVIAAAYALDDLDRRLQSRRLARLVVPLLALMATAEVAVSGYRQLAGVRQFPFTRWPIPRVAGEFQQTRGNHFDLAIFPYLDLGTLSCYDETPWPASPRLAPDLPAEEYLADAGAGQVHRALWSPNRIDLDVALERPATLLVNQNWASGWRSSAGVVRSHEGLLAVDLPAGQRRVTLTMWPPLCTAGLLAMLLALGAAGWLVRRDRVRQP